ncbi:hypothetical protein B0H16DRAFT_1698358 [Mycena metata]|uniref:Uncharacterized protein n=1 Tax=Mycena metata TaxID=1033252 RepID=A0AAD7HQS6_9AGAR|nr:hypothetical protein B0H16DRAFT_1698358 [Mycena metata]
MNELKTTSSRWFVSLSQDRGHRCLSALGWRIRRPVGLPPVAVTGTAVILRPVDSKFLALTVRDGQRDGRRGRGNGSTRLNIVWVFCVTEITVTPIGLTTDLSSALGKFFNQNIRSFLKRNEGSNSVGKTHNEAKTRKISDGTGTPNGCRRTVATGTGGSPNPYPSACYSRGNLSSASRRGAVDLSDMKDDPIFIAPGLPDGIPRKTKWERRFWTPEKSIHVVQEADERRNQDGIPNVNREFSYGLEPAERRLDNVPRAFGGLYARPMHVVLKGLGGTVRETNPNGNVLCNQRILVVKAAEVKHHRQSAFRGVLNDGKTYSCCPEALGGDG